MVIGSTSQAHPLRWWHRIVLILAASVLGLVVGITPPGAHAQTSAVHVHDLRTNTMQDPIGIDNQTPPSLSWKLQSANRDEVQTAYQIRVASSQDLLSSPDVWDSGKVNSDNQRNITLEEPLTSSSAYVWQVRVWDGDDQPSGWSEPATFETALLTTDEWQADWIGGMSEADIRENWRDYTIETEFSLKEGTAFGMYFRASSDAESGYMWQLNDEETDDPRLRPHVKTDGAWEHLEDISLTDYGFDADVLAHTGTLKIEVEGDKFTTYLNGVEVSEIVDDTFTEGFVGPRTDMSTSEEVVLHSLRVSHGGEVLFHSTFEDDNPFNGGTTLVEDGLLVKDQVNVVWVPPVHLPLLRKEFSLEDGKEVASARIYASAKGIYELSLNGKTVGDHKLAPGFTDYEHRVHYQTYDVTDLLTSGENAVGAWLADGWYTGHIAWFGNRLYGERNSLIAQLHVTYTDGSSQIVATDDTWKTDAGPVVEADLLMGETYDANYEQPGWDAPDFDDVTWGEVWVDSSDATDLLRPQPDNPVRVVEEVQATSRAEVDGAYIYDFEQNLTGVPRITISGEEGETVKLRHAEVLNPDGSIYTENLRSAKATDYYTFADDETITYAPRFTQHGFRYLEISGVDNPPEASDVVAEVFSSDLEQTGTFTTSSDMLNQLQSNIFWGQRGNFISVPTDTPARDERLGYTGDLLAFIGTATFNMDSVAFVKKWMRDMRDTQERIGSGAYPDSAPRGPNQSCCTIGTAWADAGVVVPWTTWQRSGDLSIVEENWESMEWFMDHLAQEFPDLIRVDGPFGDWLNLSDSTPDEVLGTAFYAYVSGLMADMAYALGETDRGDHYSALETNIREVFVDEFIYPDGKIHGDSQTAYALSLGMGLVPEDVQDEVGERFEEKLADRDHHLSTGFVGTPWLLPALSAVDNWDSAFTLLTQTTMPSWGYEVVNGATTMWERWDSIREDGSFQDPGMNSFNHYAFGAVGDWMYQNIGGIQPVEPGYKSMIIAPQVGGELTHADVDFESPYGTISSSWNAEGDDFLLDVEVPVNTTATIVLPAQSTQGIYESGQLLADQGLTAQKKGHGAIAVEVGSGEYSFTVDAIAQTWGEIADEASSLSDDMAQASTDGDLPEETVEAVDGRLQAVINAAEEATAQADPDPDHLLALASEARLEVEAAVEALSQHEGDVVEEFLQRLDGLEEKLSALAVTFSGLEFSTHVADGDYLPGENATVTVKVTNAGQVALENLKAGINAEEWQPDPSEFDSVPTLEPGETWEEETLVRVPDDHLPGRATIPVELTYTRGGVALKAQENATLTVGTGVEISEVTITDDHLVPGEEVEFGFTLTNNSDVSVSGDAYVETPDGWAAATGGQGITLKAGKSTKVKLTGFVPWTLAEEDVEFRVGLENSGTSITSKKASAPAVVDAPPTLGDVVDHVDFGDDDSEAAHNLDASEDSGVSEEAGHTRRYAGMDPNTYFEVDMEVPLNEPFVITGIETFDGPRTKEYLVYVDGQVVQEHKYTRVEDSHGVNNYQILVDDPDLFSDSGTVTIRFEHPPTSNYDPSLADAWTWALPEDATPPQVEALVSPAIPDGKKGWYTSEVEVDFRAIDDHPGDLEVQYDRGEGWQVHNQKVIFDHSGEHNLRYRAIDEAGNVSDTKELTLNVDVDAPSTELEVVTSPEQEAQNEAQVVFNATDDASGVAFTEYSVDGQTWVEADDDGVELSGVGEHQVRFRSTDVAGNVEPVRTALITITDKQAPVVSLEFTKDQRRGWFPDNTELIVTAVDSQGVEAIEYRIDDGSWHDYDAPLLLPEGQYTIGVRATDQAGNTSDPVEASVKVDRNPPQVWAGQTEQGSIVTVARDALSGVEAITYSSDGDDWVGLAEHGKQTGTTLVRASDKAGNTSDPIPADGVDQGAPLELIPGTTIHVEANGFLPGQKVEVRIQEGERVLETVTADADGIIRVVTEVPGDLKAGAYTLEFRPLSTPSDPPSDDEEPGSDPSGGQDSADGSDGVEIPVEVLPETGFGMSHVALFALGLVVAGLAVAILRKRGYITAGSLRGSKG